jgi:hypothetical protein
MILELVGGAYGLGYAEAVDDIIDMDGVHPLI